MRQWMAAAAMAASVAMSAPATARTVVYTGAGFGATQEEFGAPGSIGFTVGAMRAIPLSREAIGVEVTYQRLGNAGYYPRQFQSVVPVTLQVFEPVGVQRDRMAYLTAGAGVYVRYFSMPYLRNINVAHLDAMILPSGSDRYTDTSTGAGFNLGVGLKSRVPRGDTAFGIDVRMHGMWPRGYTTLWTFGGRLYF